MQNNKNNLFTRFLSIFKRKAPELTAEQNTKDEDAAAGKEQKKESSDWVNIYGHGFHNAVYKIPEDADSFPEYLHHSNELERLTELKKINDNELNEISKTLNEEGKKVETYNSAIIKNEEAVHFLSDKIAFARSKITIWETRNLQLFQKREQINPEYGWIPALLFLGAGVLFILGDISITSDITSTGFNMTKSEGLLFAIGLALTAFLIKPLIDRFLEKPFQKAGLELKKVYKFVLISITVVGLIMLLFLGKFRAESKTSIAQLAKITTEQKQVGLSSPRIFELQQQTNVITSDLANNWWGQWGIILSTIIFAVGGAMCLAVAFPSLTQLCNRYWFLPFRRCVNKIIIRSREKDIEKYNQELEKYTVILKQSEVFLSQLSVSSLKEKLQTCKTIQSEILQAYYSTRYNKEGQLYKDGYNRGLVYTLDGDLKFKVLDPISLQDKSSVAHNGNATNGESYANEKRAYTRRPFVKIRKMIADNYNQNQNSTNQDGTEFEIVS